MQLFVIGSDKEPNRLAFRHGANADTILKRTLKKMWGRSSFAARAVPSLSRVACTMPVLTVNSRIQIPHEEFTFTFVRSSGPGGQNVNKVNSKAVLRWPMMQSRGAACGSAASVRGSLWAAVDRRGRVGAFQPALSRSRPERGRLPGKAASRCWWRWPPAGRPQADQADAGLGHAAAGAQGAARRTKKQQRRELRRPTSYARRRRSNANLG